MAVTEGDLVVIEYPLPEGLEGPTPIVLGVDRDGNTVNIHAGTYAIAYKFEYVRERRWWIFLSTGVRVSVSHKMVKKVVQAGNPTCLSASL